MTSTYIKQILDQVNLVTAGCGPVLLYGENIDTGSRIAGLARGLTVNPTGKILNVGNCELTHCGVGFGMMMDHGQAVLFMKQLDFLLLGIDQLVNTFSYIRSTRRVGDYGSFTIFLIVCDQGYQGPQSSINAVSDIASIANIEAYCINATADVERVIAGRFVNPGFRIICLSQKLFGAPALEMAAEWHSDDNAVFRYGSGKDVTLACYNFALRPGLDVTKALQAANLSADVFHINYLPGSDMAAVIASARRTGKLVVLDDCKSINKFGDGLLADPRLKGVDSLVLSRRGLPAAEYGVDPDRYVPDQAQILRFLGRTN